MMMDILDLEESLKGVKLNSMTDVIAFIIEHLYKTMNFEPIQDLQLRVQDLQVRMTDIERPRGLDKIMIEEVKALIQAMLEQKQDQFRRDLQKTVQSGVSMHENHTRRSGFQFIQNHNNFLNNNGLSTGQQSKKQSYSAIDHPPLHHLQHLNQACFCSFNHNQRQKENKQKVFTTNSPCHHNLNELIEKQKKNKMPSISTQNLHKQLEQLRKQIKNIHKQTGERNQKLKKQYNELRIQLKRQLITKMPIDQTERLVQKFQKQTFSKINENLLKVERMEYQMRKNVIDEVRVMRKDFICDQLGKIQTKEPQNNKTAFQVTKNHEFSYSEKKASNLINKENDHSDIKKKKKAKRQQYCQDDNQNGAVFKKMEKMEKKYGKLQNIWQKIKIDMQENTKQIDFLKIQMKESFDQIFSLIEAMNTTFHPTQTMGDEWDEQKGVINSFQINPNQMSIKQNNQVKGIWISQQPNNKLTNKNMGICWEKQITNTDEGMIKFQPNKSQILVNSAGFYMVECYVYGCDSAPLLIANSQHVICKLQAKQLGNNYAVNRTPLGVKNSSNVNNQNNGIKGSSSFGNTRVFGCRQILQLRSNKGQRGGLISIRLDHNNIQDQYNSAILTIKKLA